MKVIRGLEHLSSRQRLRARVVQPGEEKVPGRPQSLFQSLKGLQESWRGAGARGREGEAQGNDLRLEEGRWRGAGRQKSFPGRVVRSWHRVLREAGAALDALWGSRPGWIGLWVHWA
uniref:Uncharacterized protein n=1 Tax=Hypotaenidia okinawae TaxID=2861861 RepID=A0A6G1RNI5_9GRUI